MASFRDLKVWQHAMKLAVECAKVAKRFPDEEQAALAEQLRRAAHSVPLNIAEGASRKGPREFRRFLDTARGSLCEVQTALEIARSMEYLSDVDFQRVDAIATETAKTASPLLARLSASSCSPLRALAP
jgi:four helix bundle protein